MTIVTHHVAYVDIFYATLFVFKKKVTNIEKKTQFLKEVL